MKGLVSFDFYEAFDELECELADAMQSEYDRINDLSPQNRADALERYEEHCEAIREAIGCVLRARHLTEDILW